MKSFTCPSCKYGIIELKSALWFLLAMYQCPYCKGEVAPNKTYEIVLMLVVPVIFCLGLLRFLREQSLDVYLAITISFSILLSYLLSKAPIRVVKSRKILGQTVAFGPAHSPINGLILVFGFGALFWSVLILERRVHGSLRHCSVSPFCLVALTSSRSKVRNMHKSLTTN